VIENRSFGAAILSKRENLPKRVDFRRIPARIVSGGIVPPFFLQKREKL
jgi:hypothetical protein